MRNTMELQKEEFRFFKELKPISLTKSAKNSVIHLLFLSLAFAFCISVADDLIELIFNPRIGIVGQVLFGTCYAGLLIWNASITLRALRGFCKSASNLSKAIWKR